MSFNSWTTQSPSAGQMSAQYNNTVVAGELDSYGNTGYLWASGLNAGSFETLLVWKYRNKMKKYFLWTFLNHFGEQSKKPVASRDHEWAEMGKEHYSMTVDTVVGATGSATIVVDFVNAGSLVKMRQYEIWQKNTLVQFVVDATPTITGGKERVTLSKKDGTNFGATDILAADVLTFKGTNFPERSGQPAGKTWRPEPKSNSLAIMKETCDYSGDALTQASIFTSGRSTFPDMTGTPIGWVPVNQDITIQAFCRQLESNLIDGQQGPTTATITGNRGFLTDIIANAGVNPTYTGALTEPDVLGVLNSFHYTTDNNFFMGFAGRNYNTGFASALRDYTSDGNFSYGNFSKTAFAELGLNVGSYTYQGKTILIEAYTNFDDNDSYNQPATPSATAYDFRDFAMFLNLSDNAGVDMEGGDTMIPYLSYVYKSFGGVDRSIVWGHLKGMTGADILGGGSDLFNVDGAMKAKYANYVASATDAELFYLLAEQGSRLLCVDVAHGYQRRIG